jgi:hypothetical protein
MYYGTPPIVTNGMVLNLDSLNPQSIPVDPTVNLVTINPTPINNLTGYDYAYGAPTVSYNAVSQSVEIQTTDSLVGWLVNNSSLNSTILDTGSLYTISFEWKLESGSTSLCRIWPQIVTGNNLTSSYSGVMRNSGSSAVTSQNTLLPNGWYLFSQTFTPFNPGVNGDRSFRLLGGGVGGGQKFHMHWRKLQLERTPYRTPFVSGSYQAWYDLSGNNRTATLLSSSISGGIPVFPAANNRVLRFDGTGSFASVNSPWSYLSSSATEVFFSANAFGISTYTPIAGYDQNDDTNFSNSVVGMIYMSNSDRKIRSSVITTTQVYRQVISNTVIQSGSYYHVVLNKDTTNGALQLYVNGILESTTTFDTGSYAQWPTLGTFKGSNIIKFSNTLSANTAFDSKYLNGTIPVFRLYNKILSQAEITQNYNALKSRFGLQ